MMRVWASFMVMVSLGACAMLSQAVGDDIRLSGQFIQGAVIRGKTEPGSTVVYNGRTLRVSETGDFVFGFAREFAGEAKLDVTFPNGRTETRTLDIAKRDYKIQRIDGLPQAKVTPRTEEQKARIAREWKQKKAARETDTPQAWFADEFIWPATGRISGVYGSQRILNGEPKNPHLGVDVAAPTGTPVVAPADGIATLAEKDMYFEGGLIFLDHGHGVISNFMHLSRIDVKPGQKVKKGEMIAAIGSTGRSTGPHLHWGMYWRDQRVDPSTLVGPMPTAVGGGE